MIVVLPNVQIALGSTQALIPRYWGSFLVLNWWGHDIDNTSQPSTGVMNE
jgi:hypothetical protein